MGRPYKISPRDVAEHIRYTLNLSGQECLQSFMHASIATDTQAQYQSRISFLQEFLDETQQHTLTLEIFATIMASMVELGDCGGATCEGYRCAILHHQITFDLWLDKDGQAWAGTEKAIKLSHGFAYRSKMKPALHQLVRAQVDEVLMDELRAYTSTRAPQYLPAFNLSYTAALRPHQLEDLEPLSYVNKRLKVIDKTANSKNKKPSHVWKDIIDPQAQQLCQDLCDSRLPTTKFFHWNPLHYRAFFQEAAEALHWHARFPGLKFDGPHTLRHGGMSNLDQLLGNADIKVKLKTLGVSASTRLRYTKRNSERTARKQPARSAKH